MSKYAEYNNRIIHQGCAKNGTRLFKIIRLLASSYWLFVSGEWVNEFPGLKLRDIFIAM